MKEYMDYLRIKLAPTLMGVKPSVLLTIKNCRSRYLSDMYTFYINNRENISKDLNVEIYELKNCRGCAKVIFYRKDLLEEVVFERWRNRYLSKFGYVNCSELNDFFIILKERFNSDHFPHEIGIFLGYPLKDVAGFCYCPEKCRKGIGRTPWKVFGNPMPSFKLINSHRKAVSQMLHSLSADLNPRMEALFSIY